MYPELYGGPWNCFKQTAKRYGVKKLYSGLLPALMADLSEKSVLFFAYGYGFVAFKLLILRTFVCSLVDGRTVLLELLIVETETMLFPVHPDTRSSS